MAKRLTKNYWIDFDSESEPILKEVSKSYNMNIAEFIRSCTYSIINQLKKENIEVTLKPTNEKAFIFIINERRKKE